MNYRNNALREYLSPAILVILGLLSSGPSFAGTSIQHSRLVTYASDVAPILNAKCVSCHHANSVAPFSLLNYKQASQHAGTIAAVTESRYMPPWRADDPGLFAHAQVLNKSQIAILQKWEKEGAPEGNVNKIPVAPVYSSAWPLGTPDLVVAPKHSYHVGASGNDVYRCFVIPTHLGHDQFISAIDVRPGCPRVVHHVIAYLDTTGTARKLEQASHDGQPGYTSFGGPGFPASGALGGWVPGFQPHSAPSGVGILLPKDADIVLQVHYHRDGRPETDKTEVALYFQHGPVKQKMDYLPLLNPFLSIPAGDSNYTTSASVTVPINITIYTIQPHMHWLGKSMTVTATLPNGNDVTLLNVPHYSFNWQMQYAYKKPMKMPAGTRITLTAHYDNSAGNIRNPNSPPKHVWWGEQTTDEMCIAFIGFTADSENLLKNEPVHAQPIVRGAVLNSIASCAMQSFDTKHTGFVGPKGLKSFVVDMGRLEGVPTSATDPTKSVDLMLKFFDTTHQGGLNEAELVRAMSIAAAYNSAKKS